MPISVIDESLPETIQELRKRLLFWQDEANSSATKLAQVQTTLAAERKSGWIMRGALGTYASGTNWMTVEFDDIWQGDADGPTIAREALLAAAKALREHGNS